jgi:serine/threonine protein kinase
MKDFVEVITHKSENAKLEAQELVLGEKIGGGFESEVFKSTWMGTDVAVKYFKYQQPSREIGSQHGSAGSYEMKDNIKSFATEVAIMMSLRHKNIIQLMGFGYSAPHQFIVMEFMPRGSLFDVLGHKDTTIDAARKASFISGIVSGVAYLHGAKTPVLHQDLKSLNILVDQDWTLKIADFGIAKELKKKGKKIKKAFAEGEEEIESDTHGGTLQWMPPENIIAETPERTKEVDIYALG